MIGVLCDRKARNANRCMDDKKKQQQQQQQQPQPTNKQKQNKQKQNKTKIISIIKGAQSYLFNFFSNFWRFWYHKKAHIFLITHVKFHG